MITITAFKWVPPFAQGQVRDHRVRWVLNEVGWPYEVRLLDAEDQQSARYRSEQPFGQVPILAEDGRPTLFETGAIVLDVATRAGKLLPASADQRSLMLSWYFAALNSVEPFLMNLALVDFFTKDEEEKAKRRPWALQMAAPSGSGPSAGPRRRAAAPGTASRPRSGPSARDGRGPAPARTAAPI